MKIMLDNIIIIIIIGLQDRKKLIDKPGSAQKSSNTLDRERKAGRTDAAIGSMNA
jgi:hypothetical protein